MAWDIDQAIDDFDEIALDAFGETIKYTPNGASERNVQAVVYRPKNDTLNFRPGNFNQARTELKIRVSQDATNGVATVTPNLDTIKLKVQPDDQFERVLTVTSKNAEYGTWLLGVLS